MAFLRRGSNKTAFGFELPLAKLGNNCYMVFRPYHATHAVPYPPSYSPSRSRSVKSWRKFDPSPRKNMRMEARCSATPASRTKYTSAAESIARHCAKTGSRTHLRTITSNGKRESLSLPSAASILNLRSGKNIPLVPPPAACRSSAASTSSPADCALLVSGRPTVGLACDFESKGGGGGRLYLGGVLP